MSQFCISGGQSIGVSASASVLPMNIQDRVPLGWTGWISLLSKGLSTFFSSTTVQKHQFFGAQLSLWSIRFSGAAQVPAQRKCQRCVAPDLSTSVSPFRMRTGPRLIFFPAVLAAEPGCPISTLPIPIPSRPLGSTSSPTPISQQTRGTFSSPRIVLSHHLFCVCIVSKQAGCHSLHGHAWYPCFRLSTCTLSQLLQNFLS